MNCKISIVLDQRRAKKNGKFPVKLRVFDKIQKKDKRYALDIDLTEKQFQTIWINGNSKNLRGTNKEIHKKLYAIDERANAEAEAMPVFDFSRFEMKLFRKSTDKNNVQYHFNLLIDKHKENGKIGTAESFKYTLKSFGKFSKEKKNCPIEKLTFETITVDWLKEYENFMLSLGREYTTVGIFTRTLRIVFNNAIALNDIDKVVYPFSKTKNDGLYKIPRTKKVKKALSSAQLKVLFNSEVKNDNEAKVKAFWFFSYFCNGMNIKDIALLKYSDLDKDKFTYYRAKTFSKSAEKTAITIYLTDYTKEVIATYGNKKKNSFVFDIVDRKDDSVTQYKKIKNFTRYINDHIKRIAKANDLPKEISSYWARHSFATTAIRKGASMEFVSEALNHSGMDVTKKYFAGFEDETKKEFAEKLMEF